ncbi:hypothetical protein LEM8419_02251 [Neolewinella maritima]|uniref:DUF4350 domain-containing protein n=1 Tax=Neolewinella maritima TaxID=1383882 RepID=A0ABN8F808_9BACT|nr:DUF4350 domain-containing protein [Neolewinella maritima]CAH1001350.1 hypothetical protein LEM8419_02251 [Neolewinella maritima]
MTKASPWHILIGGLAVLSLCGCPATPWYETYDYEGREPYGLYGLYELLAARPEGIHLLTDSSDLAQLDSVTGTNYLFVGHSAQYREQAVTGLLDYVERGNTVFLAANEVPEDLAYHLFGDDCYYEAFEDYSYYSDERFPTVQVDSTVAYRYPAGDSFSLVCVRYRKPARFSLHTVSDRLLCDEALDNQVLGVLDTHGINFVRLGWGEGNFYFHANPIYFTNWFLVDSQAYRYPETMLSVIGEGPVYWDEYHRRYRQDPSSGPQTVQRDYTGGRNLLEGNPTLRYIQERRELAFAWYTLLTGVFLFVVFRGRRRQRVIPIIPPRENSSKRFIDTISRLVYQKGNHAALAQRELASLRFHLNHRRGVRWTEGQPPPADLAERTGLPEAVVERALTEIRVVRAGKKLEDGDLLRFYRAIEPLYGV